MKRAHRGRAPVRYQHWNTIGNLDSEPDSATTGDHSIAFYRELWYSVATLQYPNQPRMDLAERNQRQQLSLATDRKNECTPVALDGRTRIRGCESEIELV